MAAVPVQVSTNLKVRTVEELHTQKKDLHLAAFRYLLDETTRDLERIAGGERAQDRLDSVPSWSLRLQDWLERGCMPEWLLPGMVEGTGVTFSVAGLLARIGRQCKVVLERHAAKDPSSYNVDQAFRHAVAETLDTRAVAVGTLRAYIADPGRQIEEVV